MNRKAILLCCLYNLSFLNAQELLSKTQKEILDTKEKIIKEDKKINEKDWLSNIMINSSIIRDKDKNDTKSISLSYEQKIFNFGGISYSIDLAKIQEQYELLNLNISYDKFINNIYSLVLNINILNLKIKKQILSIKNKNIDIEIKKDEYTQGQINISELNDSIISRNTLEENLVDLKRLKKEAISNLKKYTDIQYNSIIVPSLKQINLDNYLKKSKQLKLAEHNEKIKKINHKIKKSSYLPKLSVTTNTGYQEIDKNKSEDSYYNYGLKLSLPIDFSSSNEKEKAKLSELLAKKEKAQKFTEEKNRHENSVNSIKMYQALKNIARKDIKLYEELLQTTKEEYKAGYKAYEDVEILSNTKKIRELDMQLNNLYIQNELIELHF